ncbi:PI31 proteasome regulator N-terminal-domain-containing protein [Cantharellus anzutake]|uniref:PI31 proteasome regulator N-terminal-domain-containing protein n=1 Tax=Cantharellus anzutake TaxID=1750568 RepID=UPI00190497D6|nr:PI31 proteasome regulator N-terminal-domain-containing protein [Cantharellus anzutake]KAF8341468.1 PI31 proteasome regulator N-terminal-domain-containing protein [Cantharellus anzutake]
MSTKDILDPSAVLSSLPELLPSDDKLLNAPQDGIAALLHTVMTLIGSRLVGLDDSATDAEYDNNALPSEWKKHSPDSYGFRYRHEQSSLVFFLKIVKLSKRLVVHGIALEDDKTYTLEIPVSDFTSESAFPYDTASNASPLIHAFITSARANDLISSFKLCILQKLIPSLQKEGYEESNEPSAQSSQTTFQPIPVRPAPPLQPSNPEPSQPFQLPYPPSGPGRNPLEIGRSDLEPLGGLGRNPFAPPSAFPGGDGMYVGPSHPMFRDRMDPLRQGSIGTGGPRWGGDGFLPPMGAPPGARFDPVHPFPPRPHGGLGPGFRSGRGTGGTQFGPGRSGGPGDPDNDEFLPPGFNNDMYM